MMRATIFTVFLLLTACSSDSPPIVASDVVVKRPMPGMQMSAGYLTLRNNSREDITIDRVASPQFGSIEMHETVIENGVAKMVALDPVVLPAGSAVEFKPGGKHLMLMRPAGEIDTVTLEFYSADTIVLSVTVATGD